MSVNQRQPVRGTPAAPRSRRQTSRADRRHVGRGTSPHRKQGPDDHRSHPIHFFA